MDQLDRPTAILLEGPEGLYLGGHPMASTDYKALAEAIPAWAYLYPSQAWQTSLHLALPHGHFLRHERLYLMTDPRTAPYAELPEGLLLRSEAGLSLACEILIEGEVVSRSLEDIHVGNRAEIGVWTRPDIRRKGLGSLVVRATLARAAAAGITEVGWHCLATNRGSLAVAQRAGFRLANAYFAWSASLPAENAGDLEPQAWRDHAERFERGRGDLAWLDFYAAEAWAQAGMADRALAAIERLVASDWQGEARWLQESWALAPLLGHPRFEAALASRG